MIGKFQLATKQMAVLEHRGLEMPVLSDVRLESKEAKKVKTVHLLEQKESSFIMKPDNRAEINQLQTTLLSYSDDAEEQIKRAIAGH